MIPIRTTQEYRHPSPIRECSLCTLDPSVIPLPSRLRVICRVSHNPLPPMRGGAASPPSQESAPPSRHPPLKLVSASWVQGRPFTRRPDQRPRLRLRLRARGRCKLLSGLNAHRQAHLVDVRQILVRPGTFHTLERSALVGEPGEIGRGQGGGLGFVLGSVFFVDVGRATACASVRGLTAWRERMCCVCVVCV